ncbi:MAG TPA: S41 family peptidase [bacterium]|nr:S41 family peptidase [bacterium]
MSTKNIALSFISFSLLAVLFASGVIIGFKKPSLVGLAAPDAGLLPSGSLADAEGNPALEYLIKLEKGEVTFDTFWDVWDLAQTKHYSRPGDAKQLMYGAINGLLRFGYQDPYSAFLPPELNPHVEEALGKEQAGIGVELDSQNTNLTVIATLPNSPAQQAKLLTGDVITSIDHQPTEGMSVLEAIAKIRGALGTEVTLHVVRLLSDGTIEERDVTIARKAVESQSLSWRELGQGIVVIRLNTFDATTRVQWQNAVGVIADMDPVGIILDLRSNPGGDIGPVQGIVSDFLSDGLIYKTQIKGRDDVEVRVTGEGHFIETPLVVLTNTGTASAAEIVASALRSHERAPLIGSLTFGKGVLQEVYDIPVDGELHPALVSLVIGKWLTADGIWLQGIGLVPDVAIEQTPDDIENDRDPVLQKAYEILVSGTQTDFFDTRAGEAA